MLDLTDLETEAEHLADRLRRSRCCDALLPCYRCSLLRFNVLARRRVVEVPRTAPRAVRSLVLATSGRDLALRAS
jgi:hypothetical protein